MFGIDWTNADFIYANSTCFQESMMDRIYQMSLKCKRGTWFMTMSKPLPRSDRILPGDQHKTTNFFTDLANLKADRRSPTARSESDFHGLHWEHVLAVKLTMSWGIATVNLQRKVSNPVVETIPPETINEVSDVR